MPKDRRKKVSYLKKKIYKKYIYPFIYLFIILEIIMIFLHHISILEFRVVKNEITTHYNKNLSCYFIMLLSGFVVE